MKKGVPLWIAVWIGCGLTSMGLAKEAVPLAAGSSLASTPAVEVTEGTVTAIDPASPLPAIRIKDIKGQEHIFQIDAHASTVWKDGSKTDWDAVHTGNKVNIRYTAKDNKEVIKSVEVA